VNARKVVNIGVLLVISALLLAGIVYIVGIEQTARALGQAGVSAFAVVGVFTLFSLVLQAGAWAILNRPVKHRVPFHTLLKAVVVGVGGNILTPSTYLGGEPLKVVYVGRATGLPYHEVAGTVVLSKYLELISFVLFFSFCTAVAAVGFRGMLFDPPYLPIGVTMLVVAAGLLAFGLVLGLSLSRRWRPLTRLVETLARVRVLTRLLVRVRRRARAMEDQASRVFCEEGAASLGGFVAFILVHTLIFAKPAAFFFLGSRLGLRMGQLCLIFVASQALLAFQLTPSGVGTLDGGLIGTFALVGLDEAQCMAFLLCLRLWDAVVVGAGALLAARVGARILWARGSEAAEELIEEQEASEET